MTFGGRAAEDLIFGKISTGALSDLERITKMAYGMVTIYGMNAKVGNISFYDSKQSEYTFNKPYSEATARIIDEEVSKLIEGAYIRTKELLADKQKELEIIAQELLEKEVQVFPEEEKQEALVYLDSLKTEIKEKQDPAKIRTFFKGFLRIVSVPLLISLIDNGADFANNVTDLAAKFDVDISHISLPFK
jgi:ATP-dependent Zn protease